MDNSIIGGQITKFRKAAGMTQEDLGKAVGVSTQAVSRWECGGAPDITLLPAIADRLGVTIDSLFGRETGRAMDTETLVRHWGAGVPKERMFDELNRLVWTAGAKNMVKEIGLTNLEFLQSCEGDIPGSGKQLICSVLVNDQGLLFGTCGEDMSFQVICPRPEKGYGAFFADNDAYRQLFSALAVPGCLELMEYMLGRPERLFAAQTLANDMGEPLESVENWLECLEKVALMDSVEAVFPTGLTKIYQVRDDGAIVPFLYLARSLMQGNGYYMNWQGRTKPLL